MEKEFYKEDAAKVICELTGCNDALDVRVDGVYVKNEYLDEDLKQQVFTWIPACEMDWPGAPDPLTAPALTIPFSARNLAAFMLDGAGQGIQSTFGHIELAPDEDELSSLDMRATKVRKALREAYALAQQAQRVVGTDNHDEQDRAADLLSAYRVLRAEAMVREQVMESAITNDEYLLRLARVNEPLAAQKAEAQKAKGEADTGHREWLKAMVNQLLNPALSAALCATPAPVEVTASDGLAKPAASVWSLITSLKRTPGYRWPLYHFLKEAHVADKPCPKAQEVLDAWKLNPQHGLEVIKSGRYDALKYELMHGGKKTADLKAIRAAINELVIRIDHTASK